jgi:hypothetical protein
MNSTALASTGPMRLMALLMAEASPELPVGTDVMSAVVSGATITARPKPKTSCTGRTSTR